MSPVVTFSAGKLARATKAGKKSRPGWKKPQARKKDPWRLTDGWMTHVIVSKTTVNLSIAPAWSKSMTGGKGRT